MTIITTYSKKGNKYGARKTMYGGARYDSKREADYARELDLRKRARGSDKIAEWERQVRIPLVVNDSKICDYILDFRVTYVDGRVELVEVKGFETATWKLKKKLLEATYLRKYPEVKYLIVR
jgi:hypothetical protein